MYWWLDVHWYARQMKTQTWLKIRFMICFAHVYKSHKYVQYVNIYIIFSIIHLVKYIYDYICIQCGIYDYVWTNIAHFVIESILLLSLYIVMERLDSIYMWDHLGTSWGEHTRCPGSSSWPCWPCWPWAFGVVGEDFCEVLYMYFSLAVELLNRAWQFFEISILAHVKLLLVKLTK